MHVIDKYLTATANQNDNNCFRHCEKVIKTSYFKELHLEHKDINNILFV